MAINEEDRLYHRFPINSERVCYLSKDGERIGMVQELSYGGFNLKPNAPFIKSLPAKDKLAKENPFTQVELHFMGKSVRCLVEERHVATKGIGYRLIHEHTQVLLFLKEIIPFLRFGAALSIIDKAALVDQQPVFPSGLAFEGNIPVEIKIDGYDGNAIPNISMTLSHDKVVYQFVRNDTQLLTYHNVWPGGESGRLRVTNGIDVNILRIAMAVLVGYSEGKSDSQFGKLNETILNIYESLISFAAKSPKKKVG